MTKTQLALVLAACASIMFLSVPKAAALIALVVLLGGAALPFAIVALAARRNRDRKAHSKLLRSAGGRTAPAAARRPDRQEEQSAAEEEDEPTPVTLTLLLRDARYVDAHIVARAAAAAFGVEFQALPRDEVREQELAERPTVFGEGPLFGVVQGDRVLLVHHQDAPAVEARDNGVEEPGDARLRRAIDAHHAALSVQWVGQPEEPSEAEQYRIVGKLLAEFVDGDCVALYCPTDERLATIDGKLEQHLRGPNPRVVFERRRPRAVYSMGRNDRKLKAAVDEARFRFDEFAKAFERRRHDQLFAVKAPFTLEGVTEYMWVLVSAIENGLIFGTLDNDPVDLENLHPGDRVRVRRELVNDWMFTDGKRVQGNFTLSALRGK